MSDGFKFYKQTFNKIMNENYTTSIISMNKNSFPPHLKKRLARNKVTHFNVWKLDVCETVILRDDVWKLL